MDGQTVFVCVLALVTLALAYLVQRLSAQLYWEIKARRHGLRVSGQVVGLRAAENADRDRTVWYEISFTAADGREVRFEDQVPGGTRVGADIDVVYHPDRPQHATAEGESGVPGWWAKGLLLAIATALLVCVALALVAFAT